MVGLGRVELPTNGLGIGQLFLNLYVFSVFSSVDFVLFWAYSGAEHATDLATLSEAGLHYRYQYPLDREGSASSEKSQIRRILR
jgi:hypothetical protein